jgi:hypothetical protein
MDHLHRLSVDDLKICSQGLVAPDDFVDGSFQNVAPRVEIERYDVCFYIRSATVSELVEKPKPLLDVGEGSNRSGVPQENCGRFARGGPFTEKPFDQGASLRGKLG